MGEADPLQEAGQPEAANRRRSFSHKSLEVAQFLQNCYIRVAKSFMFGAKVGTGRNVR